MKTIIKNPGPFPLSKAIVHNDKYTMEISGQIGMDAKTGELAIGIEEQTVKTFEAIKSALESVGWDFTNIIKARVYLADMKDYAKMNEVYGKYFTKDYPTRVAFAVKELPRGALVEIECITSWSVCASSWCFFNSRAFAFRQKSLFKKFWKSKRSND